VPTQDEFAPDHPLPVFLTARAHDYEEQRGSSGLLKAGIFVMAAATVVIAVALTLALGDPMRIFAATDAPATQATSDQATDQSTPPVTPPLQTTAEAQASPQTVASLPSRDADAATSSPAGDPPSGALLQQFQSWAAAQDAQPPTEAARPAQDTPTQVEPVRPTLNAQPQAEPVVQGAPTTQVMQDDPPVPVRRVHRKPRPVQNARAEIRPAKRPPTIVPRERTAQARPGQDPRAVEQLPTQSSQSSSLLQSLGINRQ